MVDLASAPNVARKIAGKLDYGHLTPMVGDSLSMGSFCCFKKARNKQGKKLATTKVLRQ